ncbi:MAG: heavy-metal-associated domain-containing protein [Candidatus Sericytochromatia bacterium]|nr:heavy-metal-associated domain-containing protein [Candidatus Tanganyikabacteria bacterium]
MSTIAFDVTGMTCQGCVNRLTKVLAGTDGVTEASVTLDPAMAVLHFDPATTTPDNLQERVVRAGYGATPRQTA